jgi:hypothetical protein
MKNCKRMKGLCAAVLVLALAGCEKEAESSASAGREFAVDRLFTTDGCTVYRFEDAGRNRYFVRCESTVTTSSNVSCGKNCIREDSITTAEVPR